MCGVCVWGVGGWSGCRPTMLIDVLELRSFLVVHLAVVMAPVCCLHVKSTWRAVMAVVFIWSSSDLSGG